MTGYLAELDVRYAARMDQLTRGGKLTEALIALREVTHPRLKHPLVVKAYDARGDSQFLPTDASRYHGAAYSVQSEPTEAAGGKFYGGVYGYDLP
jgi:hypothetical protein